MVIGRTGSNSECAPCALGSQDGETMRINVKVSSGGGGRKLSANGGVPKMAAVGAMKASLAPPPGGFRLRQPLPPPKSSDVTSGIPAMAAGAESLEVSGHENGEETPKIKIQISKNQICFVVHILG